MKPNQPHPTRARFWRSAASLAAAAALTLTAAGCQTFPWAHRECRAHGGLDHITYIKPTFFAICKDGTWHTS